MARPRANTEAGKIATERWRKTMIKKYGSEESMKKNFVKIGRKGGKIGRSCGIISLKGEIMNVKGHEDYQILSTGVVIAKNGKPMKPQMDNKVYLRIQLKDAKKENGISTFKIHRLVAMHFLPNPHNLPQVDHIDGDKSNNDVSNLEWVTNEENQRRAVERGAYLSRTPENIIKYGPSILFAIMNGYVATDLFDKYGICRKTFWRAVEDGRIQVGENLPSIEGVRKKTYYYYDKSRNKWRVERSDYIKVGKQFETEEEARDYAQSCIKAGGFASNLELARKAGAKGGSISRRGPATNTKEQIRKNRNTILEMLRKRHAVKEIADATGIPASTLYKKIREGEI